MAFIVYIVIFISAALGLNAQQKPKPDYIQNQKQFIDSLYNTLSIEEKIGQLFMIDAFSSKDSSHFYHLDSLVQKYKIGGLIFFKGTPTKQALMTNYFQSVAGLPLFIAIDGEWGLAMRLDSTLQYPHQMTLGAIQNDSLLYEMGKAIAYDCKRMGIHINFAPVVDINNNPNNPVINNRSFGESWLQVSTKSIRYMKGMQDNGVMACAKHFPGHGDTDADSHYELPVIKKNLDSIKALELKPFKAVIDAGIQSIMVAHLFVPAIDATPNLPTSLSYKSTTELLKNELKFKGLVFSDALNMKGVSKYAKPEEVALQAFESGNDILLYPENVAKTIPYFINAFNTNRIKEKQLAEKVKKILVYKYDYQLFHKKQIIDIKNLTNDLHLLEHQLLQEKLFEDAITYLSHSANSLPFQLLHHSKKALVMMGDYYDSLFVNTFFQFDTAQVFFIPTKNNTSYLPSLIDSLSPFDDIIFCVYNMNRSPQKMFGLERAQIELINTISSQKNTILALFGNPYSIHFFENPHHIICAFEDFPATKIHVAQVLFGGRTAKGRLPVSVDSKFKQGDGKSSSKNFRMGYAKASSLGIEESALAKIDSIINHAIREKMMPGGQVLFARNNQIFYQKSFGYFDYDSTKKVENTDIYDIASITKVAATTLSLMKLYENKKINLESHLHEFIALPKKSLIKNISLKQILLHQSGLPAWIPFYLDYLTEEKQNEWFSNQQNSQFTVQVAENYFTRPEMLDVILNTIYKVSLTKKPEYKYSDLGFYIFPSIIQNHCQQDLSSFAFEQFYQPLELTKTTFLPLQKWPKQIIAPTENDMIFRKQIIQGFVHDPGAAMVGGISGHAGLFSNAADLAVLFQMLLNGGTYAGNKYFEPETIDFFTQTHLPNNRRGLGFDKPELDKNKPGPTAKDASPKTFGHSGFTGTSAWADPEHQLIYIFLSNRTYPSSDNKKLIENNIRTDLMQIIYDALQKTE